MTLVYITKQPGSASCSVTETSDGYEIPFPLLLEPGGRPAGVAVPGAPPAGMFLFELLLLLSPYLLLPILLLPQPGLLHRFQQLLHVGLLPLLLPGYPQVQLYQVAVVQGIRNT